MLWIGGLIWPIGFVLGIKQMPAKYVQLIIQRTVAIAESHMGGRIFIMMPQVELRKRSSDPEDTPENEKYRNTQPTS